MASENNNTDTFSTNGSGAGWYSTTNLCYARSANTTTKNLFLYNFGFSIPAGSTIDGIEVTIAGEHGDAAGTEKFKLDSFKIVKGGTVSTTDKGGTDYWTTSEVDYTKGGSSDLWGETWVYSDINASNFGVQVYGTFSNGDDISNALVQDADITVYYTENDHYGTYSETITLTSSGSKSTGKIKTDTITLSDVLESLKIIPKVFAETLTLTGSKLKDTTKLFTDTLTLTGSKLRATGKAFTDTVTMTTTKMTGFAKFFIETLTLTGTKTRLNTWIRSFTETLSFTETIKAKLKWTRRSKPSTSWSDRTEPSTSWSDRTKPSTSWTDRTEV